MADNICLYWLSTVSF